MRSIRLISVFRSIYNHDPIFNSLYLSYFHVQCFLQHRETKLITKKISATLYLLIAPKTSFPNTTLTSPLSSTFVTKAESSLSRHASSTTPIFQHPFFPFLHHRITNDIIIPLPPFTFFSPFLSIFSILPWTDGYVCTISVRVTQRPLNPRRSIKLEREVEAAPSLPPSLPSSPWWV